jgi:AcrR family transcriptional regulator
VPSTSLRARKKAATRDRLMSAALRLFGTKGFENTSVDEIAAAADVAPRTFFRYFPTKVDVLFADHDERVALLRETLASRPPGQSVVEAVRRAALAGAERIVAEPSLFLTRSRLVESVPAAHAHGRRLDADYEDVIADAVVADRDADQRADVEARVIARGAWGAVGAARDVWLASDAALDPRDLINEAFEVLEDGLRESGRLA